MNAAVLADGWLEGGAAGARAALERLSGSACPRPRRSARCSARRSTAARPLDARLFAGLHRLRPDGAAVLALRPQSAGHQSAAKRSSPRASTSSGWRSRRSSCSSPRPTSAPAAAASSATPRSRRTCCSPRPACRPCSRPSRSTATPIGTAATPAIRPSRRWSAKATRRTRSWCRSTRASAPARRAPAREILNRLNEVSFNATLMKELRMIALLRQVADPGTGEGARWARHAHPPDHDAR